MITNVIFDQQNSKTYDKDGLLAFSYVIDIYDDTHVVVTLHVSINMPTSQEQYNLLKNSSASFEIVFNQ